MELYISEAPSSAAPAPRSKDELLDLHRRACKNLEHVFKKARAMEAPRIESIYSGTVKVTCAPPYLGLKALFMHFNEIASARLVAHPSLPKHINALIILYGFDIGHCLHLSINIARYNLLLSVFVWIGIAVGNVDLNQKYEPSAALWSSYIGAWMETLRDDDKYTSRLEFLEIWADSSYDITWFNAGTMRKMWDKFVKIQADLPQLTDNASTEFLTNCLKGRMSENEFMRVGPQMALDYLLSKEKAANERKRREQMKREERERKKVLRDSELEVLKAQLIDEREAERAAHLMAKYHAVMAGEEVSSSEEEPSDLEFTSDENYDEMEVDEEYPVPAEVRLSQVDWDGELMQALLNVDTTIPIEIKFRDRPKSDRIPWMTEKAALNHLRDHATEVIDAMVALEKLTL
jgi:hypothetical protein